MGCVISACGGLKTTKLASDNDHDGESHYGGRRANGKLGVVGIVSEHELAKERPENISDNKSEIDQTTSLHCDTLMGRVTEISSEHMRSPERQRVVRLARTKEGNTLEGYKTLRTNNLSAFLLTILSRSRRHSSTRIDVTQNLSPDTSFQITNQQQVACRSQSTVPVITARPHSPAAPKMVQLSEHSSGHESSHLQDGHRLAMSCSTPTIRLDRGQHAARDQADEVSLFTSMHQLCYEIINCKLIDLSHRNETSVPLCLFVFGWPGSSKGELAFELVEHSPLIDFIGRLEKESSRMQHTECHQNNDCPLYHYLDVSSLIVANIDTRIREYNRLVAQTLRSRRQQLVSGEMGSLESLVSNKSREEELRDEIESENVSGSLQVDASQGSRDDNEENESQTTSSRDLLQSTGGSDHSSNATTTWPVTSKEPKSEPTDKERHLSDQFDLITLSTKQRSILQLKMIKYACCVTAKWVMHLLKNEIGLLEERLARASCDKRVVVQRRRVYLVNLVPNQLSLFKTCLYLQQSLPLGQLRLPHWAVKFERRTNIKLMMNKERATALASSTAESASQTSGGRAQRHSITLANPKGKRVLIQFKRLSQIRLPTILVATGPAAAVNTSTSKDISNQQDRPRDNIGHAAANLLANGPNEKLGPKYNDLFARQFDSLNKLTRLRYNPTRNYNYSDEHDQLLVQDSDANRSPSAMSTIEPDTSRTISNTCYLKLSHLIDFESHHEPLASPSDLSQVSSRAGSQLIVAWESNQPRPSSSQSHESSTASGRLLVSPSPCPSSVTSDESFALSCDLAGGHHQRQQLSPAHFRFPPNNQHQQVGQHPLKWAVELELVDEQTGDSIRWYHQSRFAGADSQPNPVGQIKLFENDLATDCCLHVYHNDKRALRSRSHASLLAPSSSATVPATICQAEDYYLVATRVAYVTGKSQAVLEVKRLHKRVIKCSGSRSDLIKLRKLISKASVNLTHDLDIWLKESIFKQAQSPPPSTLMHGRHATKSVALITYTIRIDVSKFVAAKPREVLAMRRGHSVMQPPEVPRLTVDKPQVTPDSSDGEHLGPSPSPDPIVQLLRTQPKRSSLAKQRPASARQLSNKQSGDQQEGRVVSPDGLSLQLPDQNGTSRCGSSTRSSSPRQRHVQFKLSQAPSSSGSQSARDASGILNSQRRVWLHDNLFAGSNESRLFPIMDSLVSALKSIDSE